MISFPTRTRRKRGAKRAAGLIAALLACASMVLGSDGAEGQGLALKPTAPASGRLVISGSNSMAPMVLGFGRRFSALHPGVQIEVRAVGSGQGIIDVSQGNADIGMVSRLLTAKEQEMNIFAIARDGVCLIVHKNNPVPALTNGQVSGIFTGKITNWSALGGRDAPIVVINAPPGTGAVETFTQFFGVGYADIKARSVAGSASDRAKAITDDPNAISYMSVGVALLQANKGAAIKLLPAEGIAATKQNIRTGNFPLSHPLLLLTKDPPKGWAKEFIAFSLSSQTTDLVLQHDFVPYLD